MKMKKIINLFVILAVAVQLTACLNGEDPYYAGFSFEKPTKVRNALYANTTMDSVIVQCLGPWQITADVPNMEWCSIDRMKGSGSAIYYMTVQFTPNTTGISRLAQFTITDTEHPNDAHATWQYLQYATRGDGSFGNAALVRTITSSDQWKVNISYDSKSRPVSLSMTDPNGHSEAINIDYNESSSLLSVKMSDGTLTGTMDKGYQTEKLIGSGDTIGYTSQYYSNGVQMSVSQAFNYFSSKSKSRQAYAYLLGGKSVEPDSLHTADSLTYYNQRKVEPKTVTIERYGLEYGSFDNRYQTVDVNQLILGMDDCEPLQLLAMFRYCRSTSIVKRATRVGGGVIDVTTELNADRSVRRIVVKDSRKATEVTYDFEY